MAPDPVQAAGALDPGDDVALGGAGRGGEGPLAAGAHAAALGELGGLVGRDGAVAVAGGEFVVQSVPERFAEPREHVSVLREHELVRVAAVAVAARRPRLFASHPGYDGFVAEHLSQGRGFRFERSQSRR